MIHNVFVFIFLLLPLIVKGGNLDTVINMNSPYICDTILIDSTCNISLVRCFYPETKKKSMEFLLKNSERFGIFKSYYRNGNLNVDKYYLNDQVIGEYISHYDNDAISVIGAYKYKLSDEIVIDSFLLVLNVEDFYTYYPDIPAFVIIYEEGYSIKNGRWICYYPNGNILMDSNYDNDGRLIDKNFFLPDGSRSNYEELLNRY